MMEPILPNSDASLSGQKTFANKSILFSAGKIEEGSSLHDNLPSSLSKRLHYLQKSRDSARRLPLRGLVKMKNNNYEIIL